MSTRTARDVCELCCAAPGRGSRPRARGVTLIEVLVVLFILVLMLGGVLFGVGALQRSRMKSSASRIAAAMRAGFSRSAATGKDIRLVIDFDANTIWLEEASSKLRLDAKDVTGAGGADPATEAEKSALAEANRINAGVQPARPGFRKLEGRLGETQGLHTGVVFRAVDATHEAKPVTSGRAYVYFFGPEAERASVQVKVAGSDDDKETMSVVLAPLTGRPTIADGPVTVPHPRDDAEASEAEDNGR